MPQAHEFTDYEKLMAKLCHQSVRRIARYGSIVAFDDMMQEARMGFLRASEKFDPERNVKFSTYLWTAVKNTLTRVEQNYVTQAARTRSMDATIGEDEGSTLHDIIRDENTESIESRIERSEAASENFRKLSPLAKRVVLTLEDPGSEVRKELRRMEMFRRHARAQGFVASSVKLSMPLICRMMGLTPAKTRRVCREIKDLVESIEKEQK